MPSPGSSQKGVPSAFVTPGRGSYQYCPSVNQSYNALYMLMPTIVEASLARLMASPMRLLPTKKPAVTCQSRLSGIGEKSTNNLKSIMVGFAIMSAVSSM